MNKPFSFRSELTATCAGATDLVVHAPVALKIHWGRSVKFGLSPRVATKCESGEVEQRSVSPILRVTDSPALGLFAARSSAAAGVLLALVLLPFVAPAQSLWKDEVSKPMFADKRAASIGDILTILVQESTTSSKDNKTATAKESGLDASLATFLYSPAASGLLTKGGQMPAMKFNSKSDFTGGGSINNKDQLSARAAVQVKDVLPNRNLIIEGRRETSVGGEQQTMVLRGIVRPEDVLANNTVYSYNVADASIQIVSKGTLTDSQRKGWFTKIWDKVTPF